MDSLKDALKLYFVMGSPNCHYDPRQVLKEAIKGGITLYQFREKGTGHLTGDEKRQLAKDLQTICKEHHIPFIVNDEVDLAIELGADGVHIGQEDDAIEEVRAKIGKMILGVSAHTVEEAFTAIQQGADYLGVGPMYETKTKEDAREVMGTEMIRKMRKEGITLPIVGIGGISEGRIEAVMKAGADGVAIVSAISQADDIVDATKCLLHEVKNL